MSLTNSERVEIANIVAQVLEGRLERLQKDIVAGFVEALDWHNENFAAIMEATNGETVNHLLKARARERLEARAEYAGRRKVGF